MPDSQRPKVLMTKTAVFIIDIQCVGRSFEFSQEFLSYDVRYLLRHLYITIPTKHHGTTQYFQIKHKKLFGKSKNRIYDNVAFAGQQKENHYRRYI